MKTEYSCISPGTELRCLRGKQLGTPTSSYIPGYAAVGRVVDANGGPFKEGTRVYCGGASRTDEVERCWGGHSGLFVTGSTVFEVPEGIDPVDASLVGLGAIAHRGCVQSKPAAGESVLHVGLGVIGQLSVRIHQRSGATVLGCDRSPKRVAKSLAAGIPSVVADRHLDELVEAHLPTRPTLVVDSTGVASVIAQAIDAMAHLPWDGSECPDFRYLIQGSYEAEFSVPYQSAFIRQLTILLPRDRQETDVYAFLSMLALGQIKVRDLIHRVLHPEFCQEAYKQLNDPECVPGTLVFDWNQCA